MVKVKKELFLVFLIYTIFPIAVHSYAGPVIGVIAWNAIGSLVGVICVYAFLHKDRLKKYKIINFLTKPFHKLIVKIAKKRLNKKPGK